MDWIRHEDSFHIMELAYGRKFVAGNETDLIRVKKKKSENRRYKVKSVILIPKTLTETVCLFAVVHRGYTFKKVKGTEKRCWISIFIARLRHLTEPVNKTS